MREPLPEDEDKRLEMLFRELATPVADDGFTARVMTRMSRAAWRRALLLTAAGALGAVFAAGPLMSVLELTGREVTGVAGRWHDLAGLLDKPVLLGMALLALVGPATWRWLEE